MRGLAKTAALVVFVGLLVGAGCDEEDFLSVLPDDVFEPNDSIDQFVSGANNPAADLSGTAPGTRLTDISGGETANLTYVDPVDYYKITVPTAMTDLAVACVYVHSAGDVDLYLYDDAVPANEVGSSTDATGLERIDLSGVAEGEVYYAKVVLLDGDANTYDLQWGSPGDITIP